MGRGLANGKCETANDPTQSPHLVFYSGFLFCVCHLPFGISLILKKKIGHKGGSHLWPIDLADAKV